MQAEPAKTVGSLSVENGRRTIVVHTRLAGQMARVEAARAGAHGVQILTMGQMAARLAGGFLGILFGVVSSHLVSRIADWPTFISTPSIILSVVFSMLVGVFFGYYPARKASTLNPIDALRYE